MLRKSSRSKSKFIKFNAPMGKTVYTAIVEPSDWTNGTYKLEALNALSAGVYLLEISIDGVSTTKKVVKF